MRYSGSVGEQGSVGEEGSVGGVHLSKDMYEGVKTRVRTSVGDMEYFPIDIGLDQGSTFSPFLFTIVLDELTREIQDEVSWCILFTDDIVLIDETRDGLSEKLER